MFKGGTALAMLALLAAAPGAHAELGAPFAETGAGCFGGEQTYHKLSDVLTSDHPHVAARYTTEQMIELGPLPRPPGVDLNSSIGPGAMWWPDSPVESGAQITQQEECYATQYDVPFSASIVYYDMPAPPTTYSETTGGRGYFPFLLSKPNAFVADVMVWQGQLKLEQPDTSDGLGGKDGDGNGGCCDPVPHAWQRTVTGGSTPTTATIDLGTMGAGEHTLPYRFTAGYPSPRYAVRIRLKDTPKPPGPVEPTPTPTTPPTPTLPVPGPPGAPGAPGTSALQPVPVVTPQSVPRIEVRPVSVASAARDRTKPRLSVRITGEGRFQRIRVRALAERTSVRLTIRKGTLTHHVSRTLSKGRSVSLRTRWRQARITVTGRDRAGNLATMRRALS